MSSGVWGLGLAYEPQFKPQFKPPTPVVRLDARSSKEIRGRTDGRKGGRAGGRTDGWTDGLPPTKTSAKVISGPWPLVWQTPHNPNLKNNYDLRSKLVICIPKGSVKHQIQC